MTVWLSSFSHILLHSVTLFLLKGLLSLCAWIWSQICLTDISYIFTSTVLWNQLIWIKTISEVIRQHSFVKKNCSLISANTIREAQVKVVIKILSSLRYMRVPHKNDFTKHSAWVCHSLPKWQVDQVSQFELQGEWNQMCIPPFQW